MNKEQVLKLFNIEDLPELPNAIMSVLFGDKQHRDHIYTELLSMNNHDVSYDWFQNIYESELAQRGEKKQDFTPNTVGMLLSKLTGISGRIYEPTAGNGSLLIANWWYRCSQQPAPWMHFPSQHMFECWELSNRSVPILLLNLSIRGMMGYVYHGDVLEQSVKCRYILLNRNDDTLSFSDIIKDEEQKLTIQMSINENK